MAELPHPYDAYLRLQHQSRKQTQIDSGYWGVDAALEKLLESASIAKTEITNVERVAETAARKERHRALLREKHIASEDAGDGDAVYRAIETRQVIRLVEKMVTAEDWMLLQSVAEGEPYNAIAEHRGVSAGSLRTRVSRVRQGVMALAA